MKEKEKWEKMFPEKRVLYNAHFNDGDTKRILSSPKNSSVTGVVVADVAVGLKATKFFRLHPHRLNAISLKLDPIGESESCICRYAFT